MKFRLPRKLKKALKGRNVCRWQSRIYLTMKNEDKYKDVQNSRMRAQILAFEASKLNGQTFRNDEKI